MELFTAIHGKGDKMKEIFFIPCFWVIAEGATQCFGVHITLFAMSFALVALTCKKDKKSNGNDEY
jgi:hypothetical protein